MPARHPSQLGLTASGVQSAVAFSAIVALATVSLTVSYGIPIACRITLTRRTFQTGPFNLGRFSTPIGCAAVLFIALNSVSASAKQASTWCSSQLAIFSLSAAAGHLLPPNKCALN